MKYVAISEETLETIEKDLENLKFTYYAALKTEPAGFIYGNIRADTVVRLVEELREIIGTSKLSGSAGGFN